MLRLRRAHVRGGDNPSPGQTRPNPVKAQHHGINHGHLSRPQVDLKDKWRNLEKSGRVLIKRADQIDAARAKGLVPDLPPAPSHRGGARAGRDGGGEGAEEIEGDTDEEWAADGEGGGGE